MAGRVRGVTPKRDAERARRNEPANGFARQGEAMPVKAPNARSNWDPRVRKWYRSLAKSGQHMYYQQSDWEYALIAGDLLDHIYRQQFQRVTQHMIEFNKMAQSLGTTEADRRTALRVELNPPTAEGESVGDKAMAAYGNLIQGNFENTSVAS